MNNAHTIDGYLENQMLVAMPSMMDPNFERTVTLLCQHTCEGAIGITINRTSNFTLGEIFEQLNIDCDNQKLRDEVVLDGGPVSPDRGFVLHTPEAEFDSSMDLAGNIMVTTSRDVLDAIARGEGPERYLVALGYAGWGDGQLENELKENAWLSVPADGAIVFDAPLSDRWKQAVATLGIEVPHLHDVGGRA